MGYGWGGGTAASESISRFPGASGARDMSMCRAAARFQAGSMPAGGVRARRTWPMSARLPLGA